MSEKSKTTTTTTKFGRNPEPVVFSGRKSSRDERNDDHRYDLDALANEKSNHNQGHGNNHSQRDEKKKSNRGSLRGRYSKYPPRGSNAHHSHHDREYNPSLRKSGGGYRGSSSLLKRKGSRGRGFDSYHRRSERNNNNDNNDQSYSHHNHRGKNNHRVVTIPRSPQYSPTSGFSTPDHSPSRRSSQYSPTRRSFIPDRSHPRSDFDFYGDSYYRNNTRNYPLRRSHGSSSPSTHRRSSDSPKSNNSHDNNNNNNNNNDLRKSESNLNDFPLPSSTTITTESGTTTFHQQRSHSTNQNDHSHRPHREEENSEPLDVYKILDCSPLQEFDGGDDAIMKDSLPLSRSSSSSSYVHYDYYTLDYAATPDCEDDPMDETLEDHCPSGPKEKTKGGKLDDDNSNDDDDNRKEKTVATRSISLASLSQIIDEFQPSSPLSWEYPEDCFSDGKELHTTTNNDSLLDTFPMATTTTTTTTVAPNPVPTPKPPPSVTSPSKPTTTTLSKRKGSLPVTSRKTKKKRNTNPTKIICDDEDDEITEFSSQEVKQPPRPSSSSPIPSNSAMSNKEDKGLLISLRESPQKTERTPKKTLSSHTRTLPVSPPSKSIPTTTATKASTELKTTTKPSTSLTTPQSPLNPPSLSDVNSSSTVDAARYVKIQPLDYQGDAAPGNGVYSIFADCHSQQKVIPSVVDVPHAPFVDDGSEERRTKEIVRRIQSRTIENLKVERNRLLNHLRFTSHWDITKTDHPFFGSLCLSPCNLDREEFLKLRKRCTKEFVIGAFSELWITPSGFLFVVSKCYKKHNKNQKLILNMTSKSNNRFVVSFEDMTFVPQFSEVIRLIENKADGSEELVSKIIAHQNLIPTKSSTPSSKSSKNSPPTLSSSFYVPDPYFFYLISTRKTKPSETLNALMAHSSSCNDDHSIGQRQQQRDSPEIESQKAFIEKKIHSLVENGILISGIESFDQQSTTTTTTTTNLTETKIEQHDGRVSDLSLPVCNVQSTISTEMTLISPETVEQPSLPLTTTKKRTRRDNDLVSKSGDSDELVVEPPTKLLKRDIGHRLREDCLSGGLDEITRTNLRTFFSDILSSIPKDFPETLEEFYTQTMEEINNNNNSNNNSNNNNILDGITSRLSQFLFTVQMMKSQFSVPRQPP